MISQYIYLIYIVFFYSSTHQYHVLGFINFFNTTAVSPCQLNFAYTPVSLLLWFCKSLLPFW